MLALQFLYRNPGVTSVLVGSKKAEHLRRNLELSETELDAEVMERARKI